MKIIGKYWAYLSVGVFLVLGGLFLYSAGFGKPKTEGAVYANGQWFDGEGFAERDVYVVNGAFTDRKPDKVLEVLDLNGQYVIPPMADAHTHHLSSPSQAEAINAMYLKEGIFYARSLNNSARRKDKTLALGIFNSPTGIDVAYANGGLTATDGHPIYIYESIENGIINNFEEMKNNRDVIAGSRLGEGDSYFIIDSWEDLDEKWPAIMAQDRDTLKIFLVNSEEHDKDLSDKYLFGFRGLDPAYVPEIVKRAHAAGLKVVAHVDTAYDMEVAVNAGVDELAHMPGYGNVWKLPPERYAISDEAAARAGALHVKFTPTLLYFPKQENTEIVQANLKKLVAAGAVLIIGADSYFKTPFEEVLAIQRVGDFSNQFMLKTWTMTTPQVIFPGRKLGDFKPGYEASFVVLDKNPLDALENVHAITMCVKKGLRLAICDPDPEG